MKFTIAICSWNQTLLHFFHHQFTITISIHNLRNAIGKGGQHPWGSGCWEPFLQVESWKYSIMRLNYFKKTTRVMICSNLLPHRKPTWIPKNHDLAKVTHFKHGLFLRASILNFLGAVFLSIRIWKHFVVSITHAHPSTMIICLVVEPPIWKICSSNWIIFPNIGMKITHIWNHHPVMINHCFFMYPRIFEPPRSSPIYTKLSRTSGDLMGEVQSDLIDLVDGKLNEEMMKKYPPKN